MVLEGFGAVVEVFGVVWKGLEGLGVAQGITLDGRDPPLQKQQGPPFFWGGSGGGGNPPSLLSGPFGRGIPYRDHCLSCKVG